MNKLPNTQQGKGIVTLVVVIAVIVLVVIFANDIGKLLKSFSGGLGLTGSDEKKDVNDQFFSGHNPLSSTSFDKLQLKAPAGTPLITAAAADAAATKIHNDRGIVFDDSENLIGVFQSLPTQFIVAWVAKRFLIKYNADLFDFMRKDDTLFSQGFSAATVDKVVKLVASKPLYK